MSRYIGPMALCVMGLGALSACSDDNDGRADMGTALDDMGSGVDMGGAPDAGSSDMGTEPGPLEIRGIWASNFGSEEIITAETFNGTPIRSYDNDANFVITQNPSDSDFGPDLFNRIVWTEIESGRFFYCFVDFGLPTLQEALNSQMMADDTDPESGGCGGFAWTGLRRAIEIRGEYESNFGGMETVTATIWAQGGPPMGIVDWSDDENWVVTQNDMEADFNPSLFNRIVYTQPSANGSFYYCFVDFALDTAQAARESAMTADDSDPENTGCGMFPWTRLDPR